MTSPIGEFQGLYQTLQATIRIDRTVESSYVSYDFILAHRIPRSIVKNVHSSVVNYSVRGPIIVPTINGCYQSSFELRVNSIPSCDVLLGQDWIAACACQVRNGHILDPVPGSVFANGHCWLAELPGQFRFWSSLNMILIVVYRWSSCHSSVEHC